MTECNQMREINTPVASQTPTLASRAPGLTITRLCELLPGTMLDERALAESLDVSPRTLRRMVERRELPAGVKLGARKIWFADKVREYLEARAERLAEESRREAARLKDFF